MKRYSLLAALLIMGLRGPHELAAQTDCTTPDTPLASGTQFLLFGIQFFTGGPNTYRNTPLTCDVLTEKGPRGLSLYTHCPNYSCQQSIEYGGIGLVGSLENSLRSNLVSPIGTSWFGIRARTGFTSANPARTSVAGWHRLDLMLLGITLALPVHRLDLARLNEPVALTQQYGVPFHTAHWFSPGRRVAVESPLIRTPYGVSFSFGMTGTDRDVERSSGSREPFYGQLLNPIKDVASPTSNTASDWDWYLSPSSYWKRLSLQSNWTMDFNVYPDASTINLGIVGKASLAAFVRGSLTSTFRHGEDQVLDGCPTRDENETLPVGVCRRPGRLTTRDTVQASASLTAGVKLHIHVGWLSWKEEWTLPELASRGPATASALRNTADFEVLWSGLKDPPALTLTRCPSTPPPLKVPAWLRSVVGSPVPPPDNEGDGNITTFANRVGQVVADTFAVCPLAPISNADLATIEAIRATYIRERQNNEQQARQKACSALTALLRQRFAVCWKYKGRIGPVVSYSRGRVECAAVQ